MHKEYHIFTETKTSHQQAFVFEVERFTEERYLNLCELWLITIQDTGEVKCRLNLTNILDLIGKQIGGNIDDKNMEILIDNFKEVLPEEKQLEIQMELVEKQIDKNYINDVDKITKAGEYVDILYDKNNNNMVKKVIDSIIEKRMKNE